jgi:hypothetical protein
MIRARDIDLSQDLRFVRRSWVAERAGWGALAALIVAGLLGLLGPGLLSKKTLEGPLRAEFSRFERLDTPADLKLRLQRGARNLWIEKRWLEEVDVESVRPEPLRVSDEGEWAVYSFAAREDVDVHLGYRYHQAGAMKGRFGVSPDKTVTLKQFVYP